MLIPRRRVLAEMPLDFRKVEISITNARGASAMRQNNNRSTSPRLFVRPELIGATQHGRSVTLCGTRDVQSYALLGISSFLDIKTCICLLSLDINLPDGIPIDIEVLVRLAGRISTFCDVLLIRLKNVEYGVKFA